MHYQHTVSAIILFKPHTYKYIYIQNLAVKLLSVKLCSLICFNMGFYTTSNSFYCLIAKITVVKCFISITRHLPSLYSVPA